MKIGLFFGSNTGNTEINAGLMKKEFDKVDPNLVEIHNIGLVDVKKMEEYDAMIVGCPTWNVGELQDDWALKFDSLNDLNLKGKKIAMFGVGDQFGYGDNFCDAIGILGYRFEARGAELVGFTDGRDYQYTNSAGVEQSIFLGLALDDDNRNELTEERIDYWVDALLYEFGIKSA